MYKLVIIAILVSFFGNAQNYIKINDANFARFLGEKYPTCMNGNLLDAECSAIINEENLQINALEISSLDGIEAFVNLKNLECVENKITAISNLPAGLIRLDCSMNELKSIGILPTSLEELSCAVNKLTSLPKLPESLKIIYCNFNEIKVLPKLPSNLEYLSCGSNKLSCLPSLPNSIYLGDITSNPIECIEAHASWMDEESLKIPLCNKNQEKGQKNRCICITTSLLSNDKLEMEDVNSTQLNLSNVSNEDEKSIELNNLNTTVTLFPNPTKGNITIKADNIINRVIIKDIDGKVVTIDSINQLETGLNQIEVDLSDLINGIYFIQTIIGNQSSTYKVVKSN